MLVLMMLCHVAGRLSCKLLLPANELLLPLLLLHTLQQIRAIYSSWLRHSISTVTVL
jgi:hypothetical protein